MAGILASGGGGVRAADETSAGPGFPPEVGAIFRGNCLPCHSAQSKMGGLALENHADLLKGGKHGPALVPGDSDASRLVQMLEGKVQPTMPMGGKLEPDQIAAIKAWIHSGAPASQQAAGLGSIPGGPIPDIHPTVAVSPQSGSVAFSPDSRWLAVGSYREVRLVDPANGEVAAKLAGHAEVVRAVAFSPNGKWLAAAGGLPSRWGEVKIWDLETRQLVHTLQGHDDCIYAVAFSPDGKLLATGSYDKLILLWDVASGRQVKRLKDHIDAVFSLSFSSDGRFLASAAQDSSVKIWDVNSGERLYTLGEPLDSLYSVSFHPSGRRLAAGGVDRVIRIWEVTENNGTLIRSMIGHEGPILQVAFSPDGKRLVTTAEDRTLKIWNPETLTEEKVLEKQSDWVMGLAFNREGNWLAVGRYDGSVSIYDASDYHQVAKLILAGP